MGLQEHEFDVAPELLAALSRGAAGPLLDAALVHGANVAEAAAELRAAEQSERLRAAADSVKGALSAALHGAEAAVRDVGDRGAFDAGRVGGGLPGGPTRVGEGLGPSRLGPGRGTGRIGIGKHGFVRGSTVTDFVGAVAVGRPLAVSHSYVLSGGTPLLPRNAAETALYESARDADRRASALQVSSPPAAAPDAGDAQAEREYWRRKADERWALYFQLRDPPKTVDNPDSDSSGSAGFDTRVAAEAVYRMLRSLGGLGFLESTEKRAGPARAKILDAVDPSPDNDRATAYGAEIQHWSQWLIDPIP